MRRLNSESVGAWTRASRILVLWAIGLGVGTLPLLGATYYVDGNCPNAGSGSSIACGPSGGSGPLTSLQAGIDKLTSPGDVLKVRGVHPAHDGETAAFDGRYHNDWYPIGNKNGASGSPIVIESYNYGTPSAESVYLDGTTAPTGNWTPCSTCSSGFCAGVPGTCGDVWYATSSGTSAMVIGAQKPDGTPTYRVASASALTSQYSSYSTYASGGTILVRWGSALPNKPFVLYNNNGMGFFIGYGGKSSYITIRGFTLRTHRRAAFLIQSTTPPSSNIVIEGNRILYSFDVQNQGSDYGIGSYGASQVTIRNNEIAWTGSEAIHTQAAASGPSVYTIEGNWIHETGDQTISGPEVRGTPWGMILGDAGGGTGNGDYTGSVVQNNLIERQSNNGTGAVGGGIVLENNSNNWIIRNNVFRDSARECLKLDASGVSNNNNEIYNNLFFDCGLNPGGSAGGGPGIFLYSAGAGKATSNNRIYNNTFVNNRGPYGAAIGLDCFGACTGNVIRNNIMYDSGSRKLVRWPGGGTFQNNLVYAPTSGTLVEFNGRTFGCSGLVTTADVDGDGSANDKVRCTDPLFVSLNGDDYHLLAGSPAMDGGSSVGMPAGRTSSINNTLAGIHGLPSYSDNAPMAGAGWDMGAVELGSVGGLPTASITLSDPSPTAAGTVTVTLVTSVSVVQLPALLVFTANGGGLTSIPLTGAVPGRQFTGTFTVNSSIPDGPGTFSLPVGSLVDGSGNIGNAISSGAQTTIDKTAPAAPANLRSGT